jgi:hypothetical protein
MAMLAAIKHPFPKTSATGVKYGMLLPLLITVSSIIVGSSAEVLHNIEE